MKNPKTFAFSRKYLHKNYQMRNVLATFAARKIDDMDWLINLFTTTDSVAHIVVLYAVVIATGVYLGKIKVGAFLSA